MDKVFYNKLIRDKIPAKIRSRGEQYKIRRVSDDQEFEQELLKKIVEEATALSQVRTREHLLDELSDLLAVLDELQRHEKISATELLKAKKINIAKKGGFKKRIFLHWSSDMGYRSNETPQGTRIKNKK